MKLTLPFPPSVNTYWRSPNSGPLKGRTLISAKGRAFQSEASAAIVEQLRRLPKPSTAPAVVEIVLFPPDQRRRDLDNYNKALFDALTHAGVWEDDSQVKKNAGGVGTSGTEGQGRDNHHAIHSGDGYMSSCGLKEERYGSNVKKCKRSGRAGPSQYNQWRQYD